MHRDTDVEKHQECFIGEQSKVDALDEEKSLLVPMVNCIELYDG
jgi:hypothetical protein